ncbi:hypothetical protein VKT23_005096 [Stygiomarasmius scandens]|uniref:Uncharacterized protein n=1 Tax=Marasmiellus scandens TaxID=2682957 RepID=A0ABR1JU48_9AGAR
MLSDLFRMDTVHGRVVYRKTANLSTRRDSIGRSLLRTESTSNLLYNRQDQQSSLTLDSRVIASGFTDNGLDQREPGQVASLTSTNNFVNFCLTAPNLPITNGRQIQSGSCNPAPLGAAPSVDNMPSTKFINPGNGAKLKAGDPFTISVATQKLGTGSFTNIQETFLAAPQQLNSNGLVTGYYTIVIDELSSPVQTTPTDPKQFVLWRALFGVAQNGVVSADVDTGLPAGSYRLTATPYTANHQPILSPIEQHGFFGDVVYFSVTGNARVSVISTQFPASTGFATPIGTGSATPIGTGSATPIGTGSTTPTSSNLSDGRSDSRVDIGAVVGGVVSGVLFLALLIVSWLSLRSCRRHRVPTSATSAVNRLLPRPGRMSRLLNIFRRVTIPTFIQLEERHASASNTSVQQTPASDASRDELMLAAAQAAPDTTLRGVDSGTAENRTDVKDSGFAESTRPSASSGSSVRQTDWSLHPDSASSPQQSIHNRASRTRVGDMTRQALAGSIASDATLAAWLSKDSGSRPESPQPSAPLPSSPIPLPADSDVVPFRAPNERVPSWSTMSPVPSYHTHA